MRSMWLTLVAMTAALALASSANAEQLRYRGRYPDSSNGLIELGPSEYSVTPGTEIPGWGRVKEVSDRHLVIEQTLTEREKHLIREQGAMPYDVLEIHVPREDLRQPKGRALPPVTR